MPERTSQDDFERFKDAIGLLFAAVTANGRSPQTIRDALDLEAVALVSPFHDENPMAHLHNLQTALEDGLALVFGCECLPRPEGEDDADESPSIHRDDADWD